MDREEVLSRLAAAENEIAECKKLLNQPEEKKLPTYAEIVKEMHPAFYFGVDGAICDLDSQTPCAYCFVDDNTAEREAIRTKFLNIAAWFNRGKEFDWKDWREEKYYPYYTPKDGNINIACSLETRTPFVIYFHSRQDCLDAIQILGAEEFKKLF